MSLSDFYFKKLGKMINDHDYDLNERYAPRLLDAGFIHLLKYFQNTRGFHIDCCYYAVTHKGKLAYLDWQQRQPGETLIKAIRDNYGKEEKVISIEK